MPTILVADDDRICRTVLERALTQWGHTVTCCDEGSAAWKILSTPNSIDIAILDWFMPGLTGPEIAERHAQLENSKFVYTLILSGQMEKIHVIEALHRGAHDVMEKPCDLNLLHSRIASASKIVQEKRTVEQMAEIMERYATQMESLAAERAQQLVHAERMSSLGVLAAGIAHEINNPMSFISGNVQSLARYWQDLEPLLREGVKNSSAADKKLPFILEEMPKALQSIMKGVERVTTIVKGLKKYSGNQKVIERQPLDINNCIEQALELCRGTIGKQTEIRLELCKTIRPTIGNSIEIEQVLVNLLVNAAHAMEGKSTQIITIHSTEDGGTAVVSIADTGGGIPEELLTKIWDPFFTTKPQGKGTGLGLSISSGIIKSHGGIMTARNRDSGGSVLEFRLPIHTEAN